MYIKEIFIESFGRICHKTYRFSEGINLLYGPNESGKTTLLDFLLFSFYGFKVKNSRDDANLKSKYSHDGGKKTGGSVKFVSQGLEYLLVRYYFSGHYELTLYCTTTGEEIKDYEILNSLGEYFLGVHCGAFLKTAYFSSLSAKISADSSDEIVTKLRNLFESGSIEVSYKESRSKLVEEIASLQSTKRKNALIPSIEEKIKDVKEKIIKSEADKERNLQEHKKLEQLKNKIAELSEEIEDNVYKRSQIVLDEIPYTLSLKSVLLFLSCILCAALSLILYFKNMLYAVLFAVFLIFLLSLAIVINRSEKMDFYNERKRKLFTLKTIDDKIDVLRAEKNDAELAFAIASEKQKSYYLSGTNDLENELSILNGQHLIYQKRLSALKLSLECLDRAYEDMKTVFAPELCNRAGYVLEILSSGKYKELLVSDTFVINVMTENGYIEASCLSRGALEMTYIALRFALVELILAKKNTPLFLDDVFAFLDSCNLKNIAGYIENISQAKQVFLATCREEEYKIFSRNSNIINF